MDILIIILWGIFAAIGRIIGSIIGSIAVMLTNSGIMLYEKHQDQAELDRPRMTLEQEWERNPY